MRLVGHTFIDGTHSIIMVTGPWVFVLLLPDLCG